MGWPLGSPRQGRLICKKTTNRSKEPLKGLKQDEEERTSGAVPLSIAKCCYKLGKMPLVFIRVYEAIRWTIDMV